MLRLGLIPVMRRFVSRITTAVANRLSRYTGRYVSAFRMGSEIQEDICLPDSIVNCEMSLMQIPQMQTGTLTMLTGVLMLMG